MTTSQELVEYLKRRDALFQNPTLEGARAFLPEPPEGWKRDSVPLASVHKARLQWIHVTDAMIVESRKWLMDNGYLTSSRGAPPFTPESRDFERGLRGLSPLKGVV